MKKVNKAASVLFAMILATSFISGCGSQSKSESSASATSSESSKSISESSAESSKEASVESSSESSAESSKAVSESSAESSKEASVESLSESSVESSKNSVESSKENSVTDPDASKTFSKSDVIRYGKIINCTEVVSLDHYASSVLSPGRYVGILKINDDSYNILIHNKAFSIEKEYVELLEEGFVPDSTFG